MALAGLSEQAKIAVARAVFDAFTPLTELGGLPLKAVRHVYFEANEHFLTQILFDFGQVSLAVSATANDDSIDFVVTQTVQAESEPVDVSHTQPWKDLIDKPFGWGWLCVNQQGYSDGLLLGFDGIEPQVMLTVVASALKLSVIFRAR